MDIPTFHPGRQGRDVPQLVVSVGGRAGLRSARQCWYHQLWIFFIGILIRMAFFKHLREYSDINLDGGFNIFYPLVDKQLDPENNQFLMETNLPTPIWQDLCLC